MKNKKIGSLLIGGPYSGLRVRADTAVINFPERLGGAAWKTDDEPMKKQEAAAIMYVKFYLAHHRPDAGNVYIHADLADKNLIEVLLSEIERLAGPVVESAYEAGFDCGARNG